MLTRMYRTKNMLLHASALLVLFVVHMSCGMHNMTRANGPHGQGHPSYNFRINMHHTYAEPNYKEIVSTNAIGGAASGVTGGLAQLVSQDLYVALKNRLINHREYGLQVAIEQRNLIVDTQEKQTQLLEEFESWLKEYVHLLNPEEQKIVEANYEYFHNNLDTYFPTVKTVHNRAKSCCQIEPLIQKIAALENMLKKSNSDLSRPDFLKTQVPQINKQINKQIAKELLTISHELKRFVDVPQPSKFDTLVNAVTSPAGAAVCASILTAIVVHTAENMGK